MTHSMLYEENIVMIDEEQSGSKYRLISPMSAGEGEDLLASKSSDDALRRVQALLADWLRMENVVVLTAAGCSVGSGGRLMSGPPDNNLECLVLDAVGKCPLSAEASSIIEWKKKNSDFGKGNFESWLTHLFNASKLCADENSPLQSITWKNDLTLSPSAEKELCQVVERAIYAECALELLSKDLTDGTTTGSGHIPFLAKLISRDATLGRTHLFTLNYDTLFEQAMEELGIQYFDGFTGKANSRFDPSVYGLDIYYPGDVSEGRVRRFDKFLQFYKLHGSIHWSQNQNGHYHARHTDLSLWRSYRGEDSNSKAKKLHSDELPWVSSFGIIPTSQKISQTLDMPYAHLFRLFHARLNQPQTFLLVVGYGFADEHVNRIIETALMNPSLVMLVVEPNPNSPIVERIKTYQSLGQRAFVLTENTIDGGSCSYQVATFDDFARSVVPDVRWLEDYKRLRKFEEEVRKTSEKPQET